MIVLTSEQKLEAYEWAHDNLDRFARDTGGPYLCNLLLTWLFQPANVCSHNTKITIHHVPHVLQLFPELLAQKPEDAIEGKPWWHNDQRGNMQRKICLLTAMAQLAE